MATWVAIFMALIYDDKWLPSFMIPSDFLLQEVLSILFIYYDFPAGTSGKEPTC